MDRSLTDIIMTVKGMVHTCSYDWSGVSQGSFGLFDFSRTLTETLQQMVRQGNIFKLVGLDIAVLPDDGDEGEGGVAGVMRFFQPTLGRCQAWRSAFFATQKWRKIQGVPHNYNYDFRLGFDSAPEAAEKGEFGYPTPNQAWLEYYASDDSEESPQGLYLINSAAANSNQSIFDVHNLGIDINDGEENPSFGQGWTPYSPYQSTDEKIDMDFVKHETPLLVMNPAGKAKYAQVRPEEIGFQVSWSADGGSAIGGGKSTAAFQWRPVANEYLPVMCGLMEAQITDTVQTDADQTLILTFYISGWKPLVRSRRRK